MRNHKQQCRRSKTRESIMAAITALGLSLTLLTPTAALADANSQPTLTIVSLSPTSQLSGNAFNYRLTFGCSNVAADPCAEDPVITIPLGAAEGMPVTVPQNPMVQSWEVLGGELKIRLENLTQGTSGVIDFRISPPNRVTPNGTTWTLTPTMAFSDDTPSVTAAAVTSTATSTPRIKAAKKADYKYYRPGDLVTYSITWDCNTATGSVASTGVEDLTELILTDSLPVGLTFVSSVPAGASVAGQTVSWALSASQLGESCSLGAGTPITVRVTAQVDVNVPDATVLGNTVAVSGTTVTDATAATTASADISVVTALPGPQVSKSGFGPLINNIGDSGTQDVNMNNYYRSATYPGPWLGRGVAATTASSRVALDSWFMKAESRIEAMYGISVVQERPHSEFSLVDPVPCNLNNSGSEYSSFPVGGTLCSDPAFHPTLVTLDVAGSTGDERVGIPSNVVVQARLTDGTTITLDPVFQSNVINGVPLKRTFRVPDSAVGMVAEIIVPRAAGMTNNVTNVNIGGYVDDERNAGDLIRNQGQVKSFAAGEEETLTTSPTGRGTIYIKEGPQIGIEKFWRPGVPDFQLRSEIFLPGETDGDLIFTDTMPAGWKVTGAVVVNVFRHGSYTYANGIGATSSTAVDPATGQTVLTVVVPKDAVNSLLRPGGLGDRLRFEVYVPTASPGPGTYKNTADVTLTDAETQEICTDGVKKSLSTATGFSCSASVNITINPPNGSAAVQVIKSVKGSNDQSFKTFPAIGHVDGNGGTVTFRLSWTNKGAASLENVVTYDLLPRPGDLGTIPTTQNQPRGSTFQPTLTGISTLPSGTTAYYSTDVNPCRPEVLPNVQNPGCVDNWIAMQASPEPSLLQHVTALKFVSTATYAYGQGFSIDVNMSTPAGIVETDVAWNTFASAQKNKTNGEQLPVVESAKVGIAHKDFSHITIDKIVDKATARVGDELTYTVTAVNDGGSNLSGILLRDSLPDGVEFVSATGGGVHLDGLVTWELANMPLGQLFRFTVKVKIAEGNEMLVDESGAELVNRWGVDGTTPVTPLHPCPEPNDAHESCAKTDILGALSWAKVNDSSVLLAGSKWTLQALDGSDEPMGPVIEIDDCVQGSCSGPDTDPTAGKFELVGLAPGTYRLIETKAPLGYALSSTPKTIEVLASTRTTAFGEIVNQRQIVPSIPLTGGVGELVFTIGGGAIGVLAAVLYLLRRRAKRSYVGILVP